MNDKFKKFLIREGFTNETGSESPGAIIDRFLQQADTPELGYGDSEWQSNIRKLKQRVLNIVEQCRSMMED